MKSRRERDGQAASKSREFKGEEHGCSRVGRASEPCVKRRVRGRMEETDRRRVRESGGSAKGGGKRRREGETYETDMNFERCKSTQAS